MKFQRGITVVELVVICCIVSLMLMIAIPKFIDGMTKTKMWGEGMTTLNVFEAAQLAYFAQNNRLGTLDSLVFTSRLDSSEYFYFTSDTTGRYTATAKKRIGRFKKGSWMRTAIAIAGGIPQISRSCSSGDTMVVKRYIANFFY